MWLPPITVVRVYVRLDFLSGEQGQADGPPDELKERARLYMDYIFERANDAAPEPKVCSDPKCHLVSPCHEPWIGTARMFAISILD